MNEILVLKKTINEVSDAVCNKFNEILGLIDCSSKKTKLSVASTCDELQEHCVLLKTKLNKRV